MAREIIISLLCDPCLANDIRVEGEETPPIQIGHAKPRRIALCKQEHWELYETFAEMLKELGQIDDATAKPVATQGGKGGKRTRSDYGPFPQGEWPCPVCAHPYADKGHVQSHMRKQHHITLGEYLANHEGEQLILPEVVAPKPKSRPEPAPRPKHNLLGSVAKDVALWCPHPDCAHRTKPFKNKSSLGVHFTNGSDKIGHGMPLGKWLREHPEAMASLFRDGD